LRNGSLQSKNADGQVRWLNALDIVVRTTAGGGKIAAIVAVAMLVTYLLPVGKVIQLRAYEASVAVDVEIGHGALPERSKRKNRQQHCGQ